MAIQIKTLVASLLSAAVAAGGSRAAAAGPTYRGDVRKVLKTHCVSCHGKSRPSGDLDLSSHEAILAGSSAGEVITPGEPADSFLYLVAAHEEEPIMPPGGKRIPDADLAMLKTWIELGAPFDTDDINPAKVSRSDTDATEPEGPIESSRPVSTIGRAGPIIALAASPDGKLLAIGDQLRVFMYDLASETIRGVLPFPAGEPQTLRFSRDGQYVLTAGGVHAESSAVVVWSIEPFECVWRFEGDGQDVALAADLSPDTSRVVLGGPDRIVRLIDTATGELIKQTDKHTDWVLDARFGPDGLLYATGDRDGGVYVSEASSGEHLHSLRGHTNAVTRIEWLDGGDRLATASEDGSIRVWDMHTGAQVARWIAHESGVVDFAISTDGVFSSIGRDATLKRWSIDGKEIGATSCREQPTALAAVAEGTSVYGGYDGALRLRTGQSETTLTLSRDRELPQLALATLAGAAKLPVGVPTDPAVDYAAAPPRKADEGAAGSDPVKATAPQHSMSFAEALRVNADQQQRLAGLQAKFDEAVALHKDDPNRPADLPRLLALTRASIASEVARIALEREALLRQREEQGLNRTIDERRSLTAKPIQSTSP